MSDAPAPPPPLPSRLTIGPEARHALSPVLYSLFFETEINFGGEGGVYAELVPNRDFESLGRGRLPSGPSDGVVEGELVHLGLLLHLRRLADRRARHGRRRGRRARERCR